MMRSGLPPALCLALALGCGPRVPAHDGYPDTNAKPWAKPKVLEFDALGESEIDDAVSYRRQRRARWFAVELPSFGELDVHLSAAPPLEAGREVDLAFEVLDDGFRLLTRADAEEDDAGKDRKSRTLYELVPGRYFIHVYAQERLDEADFTLRLVFRSGEQERRSDFPVAVPYVSLLPGVPLKDDAPAPVVTRRPCRGAACKKREPKDDGKKAAPMTARISGISASGDGTSIKIDRGANAGVEVGWTGAVVTKAGARIPNGSFRITRVSPSESFASVRATTDAVTSARFVQLYPPSK